MRKYSQAEAIPFSYIANDCIIVSITLISLTICLSPMEFPRFSSSLPSTALFSTSVSIYILVFLLLHRFYVCFCLPVTLFLFLSLSRLSGSGRFFTFKLPTTAGESVAINMASYLSPCRGVFHSIRSLRPFLWPANDTLPRACLANRG